jgi:L-threonylcarbamoyladenylate synthase
MTKKNIRTNPQLAIQQLQAGKIGVLPTDTIYGISARASDQVAVEKIYHLRQRDSSKPFIILINDLEELSTFDIKPPRSINLLPIFQTISTSFILSLPSSSLKKFYYLHRGQNSLAFRIPKKTSSPKNLYQILSQTGPLISTSVNPQGLPPAQNIQQAWDYFANQIDFYFDQGPLNNPPSRIIKLHPSGVLEHIR